ncbi:MAG: ABC transporter ATP-binding protein [Acidimicrobiia bacterium]|nr:ABC transporter ATP-binding protein [Acidimicrobiia bacterium]
MTHSHGLDAHLLVSRRDGFTLDVSLSIPAGHTVALLGPNGAGKSTVVATLAGLLPLDGGHITLDGRTLDDPGAGMLIPAEDRGIGVVFQDYVLFPHLTVAENVEFGLRSRKMLRRSAREQAIRWLGRFGLGDLANRRPRDLSGGQAQRVALARALITEPDLLLLDEPLAALDATTRVALRRTLADHLKQFAGPRVVITHDPTEAFLLADEIHVIEDGVITQVGTPDDIRLRPRTAYIADLAGSNLVPGTAARGTVTTGSHELHIADTRIAGSVLAAIHPRAIIIDRHQPDGSPRNTWEATVTRIEHYGDRVRLQTGDPLPLTAEITPDALDDLHIIEGSIVWISIKATEINVEAD